VEVREQEEACGRFCSPRSIFSGCPYCGEQYCVEGSCCEGRYVAVVLANRGIWLVL